MRTLLFVVPLLFFVTDVDARRRSVRDPPPIDPCSVLTQQVVDAHFPGSGATGGAGRFAKNMCTYRWDKANKAEIEKKNQASIQEKMKQKMAAMRSGKKGNNSAAGWAQAPTQNEVWLSVPQVELKSTEQAKRSFESAVNRLNRGIKSRAKAGEREVKVKFQAKTEDVAGVGDRAVWAPKLHELGVLDGDRFFWVGVKVHNDDAKDRAEAIELAKRVLAAKGGADDK